MSGVLRPSVVPELSKRHREDRPGEPAVELLERVAIASTDSFDQTAVAFRGCHGHRHIEG